MNGKVSKMLKKMKSDDKTSKKMFQSLTSNQKGKIRAVFRTKGPGPAVVEFGKQLGNIT